MEEVECSRRKWERTWREMECRVTSEGAEPWLERPLQAQFHEINGIGLEKRSSEEKPGVRRREGSGKPEL